MGVCAFTDGAKDDYERKTNGLKSNRRARTGSCRTFTKWTSAFVRSAEMSTHLCVRKLCVRAVTRLGLFMVLMPVMVDKEVSAAGASESCTVSAK